MRSAGNLISSTGRAAQAQATLSSSTEIEPGSIVFIRIIERE